MVKLLSWSWDSKLTWIGLNGTWCKQFCHSCDIINIQHSSFLAYALHLISLMTQISEQSFEKSYWENLEHYKDMELQSLKWQTSMIDRFSEQNSNGCCTRESLLLSTQVMWLQFIVWNLHVQAYLVIIFKSPKGETKHNDRHPISWDAHVFYQMKLSHQFML